MSDAVSFGLITYLMIAGWFGLCAWLSGHSPLRSSALGMVWPATAIICALNVAIEEVNG